MSATFVHEILKIVAFCEIKKYIKKTTKHILGYILTTEIYRDDQSHRD